MSSNMTIVLWTEGGVFFSKSLIALLLPDVLFDASEPSTVHMKD